MPPAKELVDTTIAEYDVAMFAKSWCPYCKRARGVLNELNLEWKKVKIIDIDLDDNEESAIQDYLKEKTGQRSVPNIFIRQKHIGGSDDLVTKKNEGVLQQLVDGKA
ncbi:putative GRX1-glutaredoxin [Exidia glandulosa HHB12029]|uniref:Putative GRX1-glutaredoxin n=1 Tax=Exidia glandulosa HHB12029 TaxID=1314781 RepID=A0A165FF72_EXIGL|nr:putative GRX1-glutaredoxin [Exidia glandulosa HHB12029]